jgi:hypothetical protein
MVVINRSFLLTLMSFVLTYLTILLKFVSKWKKTNYDVHLGKRVSKMQLKLRLATPCPYTRECIIEPKRGHHLNCWYISNEDFCSATPNTCLYLCSIRRRAYAVVSERWVCVVSAAWDGRLRWHRTVRAWVNEQLQNKTFIHAFIFVYSPSLSICWWMSLGLGIERSRINVSNRMFTLESIEEICE